ncbi:GTPase Era [Desulfonatronovibrio hydrogenovorans]|uniref:GTPase Era n=1 Tax=Desulfonatronovibrio hydrogenovorans TaxID=53245 RepID=UPI000B1F69A4|nr:GTPase Era [Desulfonatronovibrio hydrogenovorans]
MESTRDIETDGWARFRFGTMALVGLPNAGKSTLMNTLVGEKVAIVTPRPQTTRNRITGILTGDHFQVVFLDTPGINRAGGRMNDLLNRAAMEGLMSADVVILLVDASRYAGRPGLLHKELALIRDRIGNFSSVLIAANKVDRIRDKKNMLPVMEELAGLFPEREIMPVSALTGEGCPFLLDRAVNLLPWGEALYPEDQISTLPMRFMVAEVVREKLFMHTRQEVPYGLAVEIESWDEEENLIRIGALVYVLKNTHKSIVIGKKGRILKEVGIEARKEIESLTGKKVFLETWVKVRPGWTENQGILSSLGLG